MQILHSLIMFTSISHVQPLAGCIWLYESSGSLLPSGTSLTVKLLFAQTFVNLVDINQVNFIGNLRVALLF